MLTVCFRRVVDVFAMPQSGTGVSVEAVDPVYVCLNVELSQEPAEQSVFTANADDGHAQADRETRDGGRMVPLSPWLRMLAVQRRCKHAASMPLKTART